MSQHGLLGLIALLLAAVSLQPACSQTPSGGAAEPLRIDWEVKNRFRLFRNEADFQRHLAAYRGDGVLAAERRLAGESDGRGWARDMVGRLCVDENGRILGTCQRDGERENYLAPRDHRIGAVLAGTVPANATCTWTFDDGEGEARKSEVPCEEEVRLRVAYGRTTQVSVDVAVPDGTAQHVAGEIKVRDLLIAGLGDSVAAGEGNPDRPVPLSDGGFCFRRFFGGGRNEYYRPGRAGYSGNKSCATGPSDATVNSDWDRHGARWMSAACHRSLYGYQMRTALALAVENTQVAVTFLPLACSGATIEVGLFRPQRARECPRPGTNAPCPRSVPAQLAELNDALAAAQRDRPDRKLDLVLLTVGANDALFSGLVADVIVDAPTERLLLGRGGHIATVDEADLVLSRELPAGFARLRAALKPLVGGKLAHVVYVTYGHPTLNSADAVCPGGRDGFDVHPAFNADGERLRRVADFVSARFLPAVKALALCEGAAGCSEEERMSFADAHQAAFAAHGVCARAEDDPTFDRKCFSAEGKSFEADLAAAATDPMACGLPATEYRPYASRARWVRTANDSYFTAMTYPQGMPAMLQPSDIHDATWGVLAAVYGGAVHPTAEGHAAMADAALPAARGVLELPTPSAIISAPLPPAAAEPAPEAPPKPVPEAPPKP